MNTSKTIGRFGTRHARHGKNTHIQPPIQHKSRKWATQGRTREFVSSPDGKIAILKSKHTRQDIQMAVEFIYTRLNNPDIYDYKKLTRVCNT